MTFMRLVSLVGVGVLVLVANVAMTILYMVIYGHLVNPGHPKEFYDAHVKVAAPYCSIVAGAPLMFLAGLWVAGWAGTNGPLGLKAALIVWLAYTIIDLAIVLMAGGMSTKLWVIVGVSILTKLVAAYFGGVVAGRLAVPR